MMVNHPVGAGELHRKHKVTEKLRVSEEEARNEAHIRLGLM